MNASTVVSIDRSPIMQCRECGIHSSYSKTGLCSLCGSWELIASMGLAKNQVIIRGELYRIEPMPEPCPRYDCLGHAGAGWKITRGDEVIFTRNLWFVATVPERLRDVLPDNAVKEAL